MHTLQLVYNIVSVVLMAFMCFIWSKDGLLNVLFKMVFFCAMVLGIVVLVKTV